MLMAKHPHELGQDNRKILSTITQTKSGPPNLATQLLLIFYATHERDTRGNNPASTEKLSSYPRPTVLGRLINP